MKTKKNKFLFSISRLFLFTSLIISLQCFSGCSDTVTSGGTLPGNTRQARTESEFALNTEWKAVPGAVIVDELEDLNSPPSLDDTGPIGEDIIPYTYTETAEHRFTIDDSSYFRMKLVSDSTGLAVVELEPNSTVLVTVPAGNYKMHLISLLSYSAASPYGKVVFIQPNSKTPYGGSGGVNYGPDDLNTLLRTGRCTGCYLDYLNLKGKNLRGIKVFASTFNHSDLSGAWIIGANISWCVFEHAIMIDTHLDSTFLYFSNFIDANMEGAGGIKIKMEIVTTEDCNLNKCVLNNCDISESNFLKNTQLSEMDATGSNFSYTSFNNCQGSDINFKNSVLRNCSFKSKFKRARLYNTDFCGSSFSLAWEGSLKYSNTKCFPY